eukprot:TRINITY_DN1216_c0_g1_i5.p1 TRINITY_DN1216_c0_g1~~TRINITY_DN1216_c0_g1_i5.p1  ORF type:complete len:174 (+),score=6.44 TRINITY_DN1216_c0_g1_i5:589-1110(+)
MVCLLLKQTPEFPYLKYESGSLQINWVLGHTLERDKWFVWKRIPLFIIPPFVALIVVLLRSDMDIYSSFLLSADFMDPYNQFLMVVLFLVTSQFVYRYIHRIKWSQSASFSDDKDKKMKTVIRSSSFVMTRYLRSPHPLLFFAYLQPRTSSSLIIILYNVYHYFFTVLGQYLV